MKRLTAILLILAMAAGLFGCQTEELRSPSSFYYYRSDPKFAGTDGVIAPETRELAGIEENLDAILSLYFRGPESRELENLIPADCPVPQWERSGDELHLRAHGDFHPEGLEAGFDPRLHARQLAQRQAVGNRERRPQEDGPRFRRRQEGRRGAKCIILCNNRENKRFTPSLRISTANWAFCIL